MADDDVVVVVVPCQLLPYAIEILDVLLSCGILTGEEERRRSVFIALLAACQSRYLERTLILLLRFQS